MKISLKKYAQALVASLENERDSKKVEQKITNILRLLTKRKQTKLIARLPEIFKDLWLKRNNRAEVKATVPYEISGKEEKQLIKLVETVLKKEISLKTQIDQNIIGGMKLEFEDFVIDASILNTLRNLKTHLKTL